ncbi:hypothetical protein TNCV_3048611 [Trichonephila clavipes]|nr:hypothetical protein TNCV_3048611 [Trichonephila clavipes]
MEVRVVIQCEWTSGSSVSAIHEYLRAVYSEESSSDSSLVLPVQRRKAVQDMVHLNDVEAFKHTNEKKKFSLNRTGVERAHWSNDEGDTLAGIPISELQQHVNGRALNSLDLPCISRLYTVDLQCRQGSSPRHSGHESMTITSKLRLPIRFWKKYRPKAFFNCF